VLNRLEVYHAQTAPLIGYYEKKGLLQAIAGDQGIDGTFAAIMKALGAKA
jgi:adenylate kinase